MKHDFNAIEARRITKNSLKLEREKLKETLDQIINDIKHRAEIGDTEHIANVPRIMADDIAKNLSNMGFDVKISIMDTKIGPLSLIHRIHISWDEKNEKQ